MPYGSYGSKYLRSLLSCFFTDVASRSFVFGSIGPITSVQQAWVYWQTDDGSPYLVYIHIHGADVLFISVWCKFMSPFPGFLDHRQMFPWHVHLKTAPVFCTVMHVNVAKWCLRQSTFSVISGNYIYYQILSITSPKANKMAKSMALSPHLNLEVPEASNRSVLRLSRERLSWSSKSWRLRRPRREVPEIPEMIKGW